MRALFISYDGLTEPLGRSQVLPYVKGLVQRGAFAAILSFEKPVDLDDPQKMQLVRDELAGTNIEWRPLRYHKKPTLPATLFDISQGIAVGAYLIQTYQLNAIHARSYVAASMALSLKKMLRRRFIFDMRNFWADEKVDSGAWPANGRLYKAAKRAERSFLQNADHIVTLTERAKEEIQGFAYLQGKVPPISVIPTCVDLELFRLGTSTKKKPIKLIYAGSLGGRYQGERLLSFAKEVAAISPGASLRVLTRAKPEEVERYRAAANLPKEALSVAEASRKEVAQELASSHAGLSFLTDAYSNRSSAPTKLAEYLATGLPLIVTPGVGDTDQLIRERKLGVIVESDDLAKPARELVALLDDEGLPARCRAAAEEFFALPTALDRYEEIWKRWGAIKG
jgi:glycosyltransferase involved in cell wall biosynthesis